MPPLGVVTNRGEMLWVLFPIRVTDVSRIRGTRRIREDTRGHDGERNRVQGDTGGTGWTREDTTYVGFGTVRPRVQIPGPRPFSYSKPAIFRRRPEPTGHSRGTISRAT